MGIKRLGVIGKRNFEGYGRGEVPAYPGSRHGVVRAVGFNGIGIWLRGVVHKGDVGGGGVCQG